MSKRCSNPECYVHERESCPLGTMSFQDCAEWIKTSDPTDNPTSSIPDEDSTRVPWSGESLGLIDLQRLSYRKKPFIVGIIGSSNAGKTTFLLACYLQLLKGSFLRFGHFSGSYTFGAWEYLANHVRFTKPDSPPNFPPHTPRGTGRVPGLLHLAFKQPSGIIIDVLLTDAPGEWFNEWAIDERSSEGANWIISHADIFIIAADSEKLSSKKTETRGSAKAETIQIIEKTIKHLGHRNLVLLWTKNEDKHEIKKTIKDQIIYSLRDIPCKQKLERSCTSSQQNEFLHILDELLLKVAAFQAEQSNQAIQVPSLINKSFEAFRGF